MKRFVKQGMEHLDPFVESLPQRFEVGEGELLFKGRNTIRAFEVAGERLAVKCFRAPSGLNSWLYATLRASKARRAYEHGVQLLALGIPTPEPLAWAECRAGGRMRECYLVTRYSTYRDLKEATDAFPAAEGAEVLAGFAAFVADLHEKGVVHGDFNNSNTQWLREANGTLRFELIDINRMQFKGRPLTRRERLHSLRRLTCPLTAYAYIMARYAERVGWSVRYTQLDAAERLIAFIRRRDRRVAVKQWLRGKQKK